jgi:hypothetical protein
MVTVEQVFTPAPSGTITVVVIDVVLPSMVTPGAGTPTPTPAVQINVPSNAYSTPVTLDVQVYGSSTANTATIGITVISSTYVISAQSGVDSGNDVSGTANSVVITLVFAYNPDLVSASARGRAGARTTQAGNTVEVATLQNGVWVPQTGVVNTTNHTISVQTTNVGQTWAVVAVAPGATPAYAASSTGKVVWAPVPVRVGDTMTLYFDKQPSSSTFKVYNMAGQKVLEGSGGTAASLTTGQMAPGVYFVRTVVSYADGSGSTQLQKFVVVR